jgi:hypothetical protein
MEVADADRNFRKSASRIPVSGRFLHERIGLRRDSTKSPAQTFVPTRYTVSSTCRYDNQAARCFWQLPNRIPNVRCETQRGSSQICSEWLRATAATFRIEESTAGYTACCSTYSNFLHTAVYSRDDNVSRSHSSPAIKDFSQDTDRLLVTHHRIGQKIHRNNPELIEQLLQRRKAVHITCTVAYGNAEQFPIDPLLHPP